MLVPIMPCDKIFFGVDVNRNAEGEHVVVVVLPDSPAEDAEIQVGSVIKKVDAMDVSHLGRHSEKGRHLAQLALC